MKKLVYLFNGFEFAASNSLSVPAGLKRLFQVYIDFGALGVLKVLRAKYLNGLNYSDWLFIVEYIERFICGFDAHVLWSVGSRNCSSKIRIIIPLKDHITSGRINRKLTDYIGRNNARN